MTLKERVRSWLGVNILIRQNADLAPKTLVAGCEAKNRERHAEVLERLNKIEAKLMIQHVGRKENTEPTSWEAVQVQELAKMLKNPQEDN